MYAVPLMILTLTHSSALTGVAFLIEWVPRLITIAGSGPLIDRFHPRAALLTTSALRAAAAVVALIALALGGGTLAVLLFGVVVGMLSEASYLASESLSAQASQRAAERGHHVQSVMTGIDQTTLLVGPLLGGALLLVSPTLLLAAVAVLSCVTTTAAMVLRDSPHPPTGTTPAAEQRPLAAIAKGLETVRRTPALVWLVGLLAVVNLVSGVLQVSAPITVTGRLGHSTAAVGTVWSLAAAASLLAVGAARRAVDHFGLYAVGLAGAMLMCVATLAAGLATTLLTYAAAIAAMMAAEGALTVVLRTARARLIPKSGIATALAATVLLVLAPFPLAGLLVAAVPAHAIPHLVIAMSTLQLAATALCFKGLWIHRTDYEQPQA